MRIYTRGVNQSLIIDEDVHVTVLKIYSDHVRLAISQPRQTPSYWEQLLYVSDDDAEGADCTVDQLVGSDDGENSGTPSPLNLWPSSSTSAYN